MIYYILRVFSIFIPARKIRKRYNEWAKRYFSFKHRMQRWISEQHKKDNELLYAAVTDPNGLGMADLIMAGPLGIKKKYQNIFYGMPVGAVVLDGGMNRGKFTDLCNIFGADIVGFEPNKKLADFLTYKYRDNKNVRVVNAGLGAEKGELTFYCDANCLTDDGFSIVDIRNSVRKETIAVKAEIIDLAEFIQKEFIDKKKRVYLLKLDIEGAEFGLIEKLIANGIHKHVDYIVCETHARFFADGKAKMESLRRAIADNNITNIDLEWV